MPQTGWSDKCERQYQHINEGIKGRSTTNVARSSAPWRRGK